MDLPTNDIAAFIEGLAAKHGVTYTPTPLDVLADKWTELSDDEVKLDRIECLIIALERAGVIPKEEVVQLHVRHLRELKTRTGAASSEKG
jgi:hypothetical protein